MLTTFAFRPFDEGIKGFPGFTGQSHGSRIRDTVIWLLLQSFEMYPDKSVIFICESSDNLAGCRQRLFDRWFRNASDLIPHEICKYNSDFAGEGCGSIIIRKDNPHHDLIRDAFETISSSDK